MTRIANRRLAWIQRKRQVTPIATQAHLSRKGLIGINLALVLVALFFGLRFQDATQANQVTWQPDRAGLHFGPYGMAYCRPVFDTATNAPSKTGTGLSFEIALRAKGLKNNRFQILLMLHGGQDKDQLVIGQWRSSLIVMHGDDYSGRQGRKRLVVADALPPGMERLITIVSDTSGTRIFIDGRRVAQTSNLILQMPNRDAPVTLVVGNSVYARHYWQGDLYGLAVYRRALSPAIVHDHFDSWKEKRDLSMAVFANPEMLYLLNDGPRQKALNRMGDVRHLTIPAKVQILKKEILNLPWKNLRGGGGGFWKDVMVNFVGFVPLGFFLSALRSESDTAAARHDFIYGVGLCFMLSLGIELAQAWIPSRSSHMLDLAINTLGGATGVILHQRWQWLRRSWKR